MNEDAIYQSKNAKILRSSVEIRGHLLNPSAIKGISFFDEQQQAYRWVKITGTILLFAMCLSFLTGEAGRVGLVVVVGTILGLVFVIGYALFPTAGAGLVIENRNGLSEIMGGIPRQELPKIRDAIIAIITRSTSPGGTMGCACAQPEPIHPTAMMPRDDPEQSAEALRLSSPELAPTPQTGGG
jgi:hypothetical protein